MRGLSALGLVLAASVFTAACIDITPPTTRPTPTTVVVVPTFTPVATPTETVSPTRTPTPTRTPFLGPTITPTAPVGATDTPTPTPTAEGAPSVGATPVQPPTISQPPPPPVVVAPPAAPPAPPVTVVQPAPPVLVPTPVSNCLGDEIMTWVPRWPRINETIVISVTSAKQRRFVRLTGWASPELIEATVGGLGYVWRWTVTLAKAGQFEYRFLSEASNEPCATGIIEILEATATPTGTATLTPTPTGTSTATPSPCGGEVFNVTPLPIVGQPFQIIVTSPRNNNPLLSGPLLQSNAPLSVINNGNGTFSFVFQVTGLSPAGVYTYSFTQGGSSCLTIPITVNPAPFGTPTPTASGGTPTNTPSGGAGTATPTPTP